MLCLLSHAVAHHEANDFRARMEIPCIEPINVLMARVFRLSNGEGLVGPGGAG